MQQQAMQSLTDQAGNLAGSPMIDPSKNPELLDSMRQAVTGAQQPPE